MSQSDPADGGFLAKHPRLIGVLFMLAVLLTQMGAAAGSGIGVGIGP